MTQPKHLDQTKLTVIMAAAGRGRRFGSDKMSELLGDQTVLETAVSALRTALPTAPMVVVVASEMLEDWRAILESNAPETLVIAGEDRRQDSVRLGVEQAAERGAEVVAIHDGARPLIHPDDVKRVIDGLGDSDAAILSAPITDTVKTVDAGGLVVETLDRDRIWLAQTPQVVRISALENAWRRADPGREWSDEAGLIEADGGEVRSVAAGHPNPKVTTVADLITMRALVGTGS